MSLCHIAGITFLQGGTWFGARSAVAPPRHMLCAVVAQQTLSTCEGLIVSVPFMTMAGYTGHIHPLAFCSAARTSLVLDSRLEHGNLLVATIPPCQHRSSPAVNLTA